jgi:hypothetical protein
LPESLKLNLPLNSSGNLDAKEMTPVLVLLPDLLGQLLSTTINLKKLYFAKCVR